MKESLRQRTASITDLFEVIQVEGDTKSLVLICPKWTTCKIGLSSPVFVAEDARFEL